ncbi:hypothetical protein QOT17_012783 [Balamuthia mandrillaris]
MRVNEEEEEAFRMARLCATEAYPDLPASFPEELWLNVMRYLNLRDLRRIGCVCTILHRLSQDSYIDPLVRFQRKKEEARQRALARLKEANNGGAPPQKKTIQASFSRRVRAASARASPLTCPGCNSSYGSATATACPACGLLRFL